jgi:phage minor structural protein
MWVIMDKKRVKVGFIDVNNDSPKSLPLLSDNLNRQLENGYDVLEFSVPANHDDAALLEKEGFIAYTADNLLFRLFRIKKITTKRGKEMSLAVVAETASTTDLLGSFIQPITFTSQSVGNIATTLLSGSGWELGNCDSVDMLDIGFTEFPSTLEAIRSLAEAGKLELEFTVEMDRKHRIVRMLVHLYKKRGQVTRERIEYRKNLEGLTKIEDTNNIATAMIAIGGQDANGKRISLTDAAVQPPEGFEKVDEYIGDLNALQEWGDNGRHIYRKYTNTEAQNPIDLYNGCLEELKKYNKPVITYEVDCKYIGIDPDIGDTLLVEDHTFNPVEVIEARVLGMETSLTKPDDDSVTLGEFVQVKVNPVKVIQNLQNKIKLKETAWDKAKEVADAAKDAADEANNKIEVKVSGVAQFNNGVGANVYTARAFQKGQEIDVDGTQLYYLWNMYDNTGIKIEGYERSGKTLTIQATEFNKRVQIECIAYELPATLTEV